MGAGCISDKLRANEIDRHHPAPVTDRHADGSDMCQSAHARNLSKHNAKRTGLFGIGDIALVAADSIAFLGQRGDTGVQRRSVDINQQQRRLPAERAGDRHAQPPAADDQNDRPLRKCNHQPSPQSGTLK